MYTKGYAGRNGIFGRSGPKGYRGVKGATPENVIYCKGEKGAQGDDTLFIAFNSTVIKGDKGPIGEPGDAGWDNYSQNIIWIYYQ